MQEEYRVEAYQELEQPDVNVGESVGHEVVVGEQLLVQRVQLLEYRSDRCLVLFLGLREAGQVHALHNILLEDLVQLVNLLLQVLRVEVERLLGRNLVEILA